MTTVLWIAGDAILGVLFLGSGYFLLRFIREKVPQARDISDEVILDRYAEDSKDNRIWTLPLKVRSGEAEYREFFRLYQAKLLYRIHIWLLRVDNRVFATYNRLRGKDESDTNSSVT